MAISPKIRQQIFARDDYRCVSCFATQGLTIQHRVSRGMGGSKLYDKPAYLITMCYPCNTMLESDANKAEIGRMKGWKMDRNTNPPLDPTTIPVMIGKRWYLLDHQFNKKEMKPNAK